MTPSTTKDLPIRPRKLYRPLEMPKMKAAPQTIRTSLAIRAEPMFKEVCLVRIMATISVPPVDAPMLKTMALPMAGSSTAKISSSRVSSVKGAGMGQMASHSET